MFSDKEAVIREKRTIEATKKNLMGAQGKFGIILKAYGSPIIRQGSGLLDAGQSLYDPYQDFSQVEYERTLSGQNGPEMFRDELLTLDDDEIYKEGVMFDGLSRGMHLEIVYWLGEHTLTVSYRGYPVYREVAGELMGYHPLPEWEDLIDRLYRSAKERVKQIKVQEVEELQIAVNQKKRSFLQQLRLRWGI